MFLHVDKFFVNNWSGTPKGPRVFGVAIVIDVDIPAGPRDPNDNNIVYNSSAKSTNVLRD